MPTLHASPCTCMYIYCNVHNYEALPKYIASYCQRFQT